MFSCLRCRFAHPTGTTYWKTSPMELRPNAARTGCQELETTAPIIEILSTSIKSLNQRFCWSPASCHCRSISSVAEFGVPSMSGTPVSAADPKTRPSASNSKLPMIDCYSLLGLLTKLRLSFVVLTNDYTIKFII
jgi:hypothetical protein